MYKSFQSSLKINFKGFQIIKLQYSKELLHLCSPKFKKTKSRVELNTVFKLKIQYQTIK